MGGGAWDGLEGENTLDLKFPVREKQSRLIFLEGFQLGENFLIGSQTIQELV